MNSLVTYSDSSDENEHNNDGNEYVLDEDESDEDGREKKRQKKWIRSFPHVDGNWPSHVFVSGIVCLSWNK